MSAVHATFCDFLVRGVGLDAKDVLTGKSDPYIVIKIPTRDPRIFLPSDTSSNDLRQSRSSQDLKQTQSNYDLKPSKSMNDQWSTVTGRNETTNITNNFQKMAMDSNQAQAYINAQGTYTAIKSSVANNAVSALSDTAGILADSNIMISSVVTAAMLTSCVYHYVRKTHPQTEGYTQIFESEVANNTLSPKWQPFRVGLFELCRGNYDVEVLIEVYDWDRFKPSDFIGAVALPVRRLLSARDEIKLQLLNERRVTSGELFLQCKPSIPKILYCDFHASAMDLDKKELFGLSDPYFVIKVPSGISEQASAYAASFPTQISIPATIGACGIQNHPSLKGYGEVFESHIVKKSLNPDWGDFRVGFYELCRGDPDVNLVIQVYDYNRILPSKLIGSTEVTVRSLLNAGGAVALPLLRKGKKRKMAGTLYLQCTPSCPLDENPTPAKQAISRRVPPPIPRGLKPQASVVNQYDEDQYEEEQYATNEPTYDTYDSPPASPAADPAYSSYPSSPANEYATYSEYPASSPYASPALSYSYGSPAAFMSQPVYEQEYAEEYVEEMAEAEPTEQYEEEEEQPQQYEEEVVEEIVITPPPRRVPPPPPRRFAPPPPSHAPPECPRTPEIEAPYEDDSHHLVRAPHLQAYPTQQPPQPPQPTQPTQYQQAVRRKPPPPPAKRLPPTPQRQAPQAHLTVPSQAQLQHYSIPPRRVPPPPPAAASNSSSYAHPPQFQAHTQSQPQIHIQRPVQAQMPPQQSRTQSQPQFQQTQQPQHYSVPPRRVPPPPPQNKPPPAQPTTSYKAAPQRTAPVSQQQHVSPPRRVPPPPPQQRPTSFPQPPSPSHTQPQHSYSQPAISRPPIQAGGRW